MATNLVPRATLGALIFVDVPDTEHLGSMLENGGFADAVTVVSRDPECTQICRQEGIEVVECDETESRASVLARLDSVAATQCDWVFLLEADERLNLELRQEVRQVVESLGDSRDHAGVSVRIQHYICGADQRYGGWTTPERRVVRREDLGRTASGVTAGDESAELILEQPLAALGHRHIGGRLRWINHVTELEQHHADIVGGWTLISRPIRRFLLLYVGQRGYRDRFTGLATAALESFRCFLAHAKAWERAQPADRADGVGREPSQ